MRIPTARSMGIGNVQQQGAGTTPEQSFNTNADMFGAAQARSLGQAAQGVDDVAKASLQVGIRAQREEDERNLMEIEQAVRDWRFQQFQGENGVYTRKGGNAIGAGRAVTEDYDKFSGGLLQGRTMSEWARLRAESFIAQEGTRMEGEVSRYERREKLNYDNGLREARIMGAKEDAATYYNDLQKLGEAETKIRNTMKSNAAANGWPPEVTQNQIEKEVSSMHRAVIDRMIANNEASAAKDYLEANRKEIGGADIATIERSVSNAGLDELAQSEADEMLAQYDDEGAALADVRKRLSGAEEKAAVSEVSSRFAEKRRLEERAKKDRFNDVSSRAASGERIGENDLIDLTQRQRDYIKRVEQDARLQAVDPDHERVGDGGKSLGRFYADSSDTFEFAQLSLEELKERYEMGVTKDEWEAKVMPTWQRIRQASSRGSSSASSGVTTTLSFDDVSKVTARQAGLIPSGAKSVSKWSDDQVANFAAWQTEFARRVEVEERIGGKKLGPVQMQSIADDMLKEKFVYDEGIISDSETFGFMATDEQLDDFASDADIPSERRAEFPDQARQIIDALRSGGRAITRENILAVWKANFGG